MVRPKALSIASLDRTASGGGKTQVAATSFLALFSIVGLPLYGLPFFYDFMVSDFHWTRAQVTSGNFYSKLLIGPLFGFVARWIIDRFGPRSFISSTYSTRSATFAAAPAQPVLISRWFNEARGG